MNEAEDLSELAYEESLEERAWWEAIAALKALFPAEIPDDFEDAMKFVSRRIQDE